MCMIRLFITRWPWKVTGVVCLGLFVIGGMSCGASGSNMQDPQWDNRFRVGYKVLNWKIIEGDQEKNLTVAVWYPTAELPSKHNYGGPTNGKVAIGAKPYKKSGPYPLLVFSHGYGGSGLGHVFLTEPLAARGWIVVAPDHNDKYSAVRIGTGQKRHYNRRGLLKHAKKISRSGPDDRDAYFYRLDEIRVVLDRILQSNEFGALIDKEKIAIGGHSFGGFTALGLCGTIKERRDERIKGVLLFSTGAGSYLFKESELAQVMIPSMHFLGEREKDQKRGTKTMAELADKLYRNFGPPKYFLELKGANHFSFNNRFTRKFSARFLSGSEEQFEVIRRYSIAFLEKYVADRKEKNGKLEEKNPLLLRYHLKLE